MRRKRSDVMRNKGFTLVELLVVISIIALLLSIMMPALGKAKNQARLVICMANSRQIATVIAAYQSANDGRVPVMLNVYAYTSVPAKFSSISLALKDYQGKLPADLNPEVPWTVAQMYGFWQNYAQPYYKCPFLSKGDNPKLAFKGTVTLNGARGGKKMTFNNYDLEGSAESYGTTWHEGLNKGRMMYDLASPDGYLKYPLLTWYKRPGDLWPGEVTERVGELRPVRWDTGMARALGGSGLSEAVILSCEKGQVLSFNNNLFNYGSHKRGNSGGTTAIFGDCHVEWVPGTQIGFH